MLVSPLEKYKENVVVVDYGMSNLSSVCNSLSLLGCEARVSGRPSEIMEADRIILPGVGAFGTGMQNLVESGIADAILDATTRNTPLLGICLGMQLLATEGFEHGAHRGLDLVSGQVLKLSGPVRIPHVGWNEVELHDDPCLYRDMGKQADFYFVHSYRFEAAHRAEVAGWCEYGECFAASVRHGCVMGVQFHPEKSHRPGLTVLKNFLQFESC